MPSTHPFPFPTAAALALLLFGSTSTELPGGYSSKELSAESPLRAIKSFPEELVMLGRATVIIKVSRPTS